LREPCLNILRIHSFGSKEKKKKEEEEAAAAAAAAIHTCRDLMACPR
jgi:hypothetical protein